MSDLITSLRALAAGRHDDLSIAVDAVIEIERLRADLATQQGCCDGAAAQDAHVRQEREEHRAEVERLRREIKNLREAMQNLAERLEVDPSGTDKIDDLEAEIERLRGEVEFLTKDLSQRFAIRYQTSAGCMCPAEANLHCQNSFCPRRNPPGVITCQGGKP